MSGVNKAIVVGRLGADPEPKYMQDGTCVVNVSIATSETWKDKNTGEKRERTEWHRVVFWQRTAEVVAQYLRKGSQCYVEGRLQTRKWTDNAGVERYTTEIRADKMQMLDAKSDSPSAGGAPAAQANSTYSQPQQAAGQAAGQAPQQAAGQAAGRGGVGYAGAPAAPPSGFDDDVPF